MKRRARPWLLPRLASPAALLRLIAAAARVRRSVEDRIDIKIRCRKTRPEARTIVSCACCAVYNARGAARRTAARCRRGKPRFAAAHRSWACTAWPRRPLRSLSAAPTARHGTVARDCASCHVSGRSSPRPFACRGSPPGPSAATVSHCGALSVCASWRADAGRSFAGRWPATRLVGAHAVRAARSADEPRRAPARSLRGG